MEQTDRQYKIEQLLYLHKDGVTKQQLLDAIERSYPTLKRDLDDLKNRGAPIEYDRFSKKYRFKHNPDPFERNHELPGLWFNSSEIHALLSMQQLLANIQPGILTPHIEPLKNRLQALLEQKSQSAEEIQDRIRLVHATKRPVVSRSFELLALATLQRKKILITHYSRKRDETSQREVSPQRIIFYRYNWYLDSWCHSENDLRSFSVDAISNVEIIDADAENISKQIMQDRFEKGFGIFSGSEIQWATIRFTPVCARWVSCEIWHPDQKSSYDSEGYYLLEVPYSHDHELLMEILKYGEEAEVIQPETLRVSTKDKLQKALKHY